MSPSTNAGATAELITWRQNESQEAHRSFITVRTGTLRNSWWGNSLLQLLSALEQDPGLTVQRLQTETALPLFGCGFLQCSIPSWWAKSAPKKKKRVSSLGFHSVHKAFLLEIYVTKVTPAGLNGQTSFTSDSVTAEWRLKKKKKPQNWNKKNRLQ